jgi:hypothetical protein
MYRKGKSRKTMKRQNNTSIKALRQPFRPMPAVGPAAHSALTYMIRRALEVK